MANIRVRELAKELEISNKELLDFLEKEGEAGLTAASGVKEEFVKKVHAWAKRKNAPAPDAKKEAPVKAETAKAESAKAESAKAEAPAKQKKKVSVVFNGPKGQRRPQRPGEDARGNRPARPGQERRPGGMRPEDGNRPIRPGMDPENRPVSKRLMQAKEEERRRALEAQKAEQEEQKRETVAPVRENAENTSATEAPVRTREQGGDARALRSLRPGGVLPRNRAAKRRRRPEAQLRQKSRRAGNQGPFQGRLRPSSGGDPR